MLISALMMFVLLVMNFLFSVVTSIPYAVSLSTNLLVRSWKFTVAADHKISVASRLHMDLPLMEMDVWWSWSVSCMIFSRNKLNRMDESKHP